MFKLFFWRRATTAPSAKEIRGSASLAAEGSASKRSKDHPVTAASHKVAKNLAESKLDSRDMEKLFHQADIRTLQSGDILHRSDDIANCFYVVVKGALRTTTAASSSGERVARLGKGSWVVDVDLSKKRLWGYNASAAEPSVVMLITQSTINAMDETLRGRLYARNHRLNCEQIERLTKAKQGLAVRANRLVSGMALLQQSDMDVLENSALINGILEKIPKLPVSTSALVNKLMDTNASTREVVELVKMDPSLTAEVLKTINSSRYRFDTPISDVNHALVMLGYDGVYQMVMAEGVRKSLPATDAFSEMYERSLAVSNIAFAISQATGIGRPSEMATIGLLHDIGMVVIELLKSNNPGVTVLINLLHRGDMGALLLRSWGIPEIVCSSIVEQQRPQFSPPAHLDASVRESVSILYLSGLVFDVMQGRYFADLPTLFLDEYLELLKLNNKSLNEIGFDLVAPILKKRRELLPTQLREIIA